MGGIKLNVQIEKGLDLGGPGAGRVRPFVVVCFDDNIEDEIYKTASQVAGDNAGEVEWNESFVLDLTTEMKNALANGHPEPTYLTFNVFDGNVPEYPSLGSAGVLLTTIHEQGFAQGEFPIVNGSGRLLLTVGDPPKKGWIHSSTAKKAGLATAVGLGAVAIGLTANHYRNKKKNKDSEGSSSSARP